MASNAEPNRVLSMASNAKIVANIVRPLCLDLDLLCCFNRNKIQAHGDVSGQGENLAANYVLESKKKWLYFLSNDQKNQVSRLVE